MQFCQPRYKLWLQSLLQRNNVDREFIMWLMKVAPKATLLNFEPQFYLVLHFIFYFCLISFCTKLFSNSITAKLKVVLFVFIHCQSIRIKETNKRIFIQLFAIYFATYLVFVAKLRKKVFKNSAYSGGH